MDELKNNRAPLLCYVKLCATFQSNWWIHPGNWKRPIRVKIGEIFLSLVTLKFNGWPWKTTWTLFYVTSSFVHHFIAIGESKLELQSGNARSGQNWRICCSLLPWNLIGYLPLLYTSSFVHRFIAICEIKLGLNWGFTSVTLTIDLWCWPFAWTSLLPMVITHGNFMLIRWNIVKKKGVTDGRTNKRTDWTIL